MSSTSEELIEEINEALEPYYEEPFDTLFDAAEALLDQFQEEDDEADDEVSDGSYHEEPAQPMTELDKLLQREEKYIQMEKALQIEEIKLQNLERDIKKEKEDFSDGYDNEEQVQAMTPLEIELQIAERALQIEERKIQKLEKE